MAKRTVIIGDVHGCIDELDDLLEVVAPNPRKDRVIFIGDLVGKGPASPEVMDRFHELNAEAILGNHEWHVLQQADNLTARSKNYRALRDAFGKKRWKRFIEEVRQWPLWIESDEFLAVHGGVRPDRALDETPVEELVNIRTWDGKGANLQSMDNPPWFEYYTAPKLIVFGHWAAQGLVERDNAIGLDTGCVYGGTLTAVELPERKIVAVPARKAYRAIRS